MQSTIKIAVAGATGRAGHHAVAVLRERGFDVVEIARAKGVDVITTEGLDAALVGVHAIIDVATGPSPEQEAATDFFTTSARNLQAAGAAAGVQRIVVASIIGVDRFASGYNAAKVAHEQAVADGPVNAHVLRAAQFHEFVEQLVTWGTQGDVAYVPRMRTQLVAAHSVAEALVDLATDPDTAGGGTSEIAGPHEESLAAVAELFAKRRGLPVRIQEAYDPSDAESELYASGALLPGPDASLVGPAYVEWLEAS